MTSAKEEYWKQQLYPFNVERLGLMLPPDSVILGTNWESDREEEYQKAFMRETDPALFSSLDFMFTRFVKRQLRDHCPMPPRNDPEIPRYLYYKANDNRKKLTRKLKTLNELKKAASKALDSYTQAMLQHEKERRQEEMQHQMNFFEKVVSPQRAKMVGSSASTAWTAFETAVEGSVPGAVGIPDVAKKEDDDEEESVEEDEESVYDEYSSYKGSINYDELCNDYEDDVSLKRLGIGPPTKEQIAKTRRKSEAFFQSIAYSPSESGDTKPAATPAGKAPPAWTGLDEGDSGSNMNVSKEEEVDLDRKLAELTKRGIAIFGKGWGPKK